MGAFAPAPRLLPDVRLAIVNLTSGGLSGGYLKYLRTVLPLLRDHIAIEALRVFVPAGTEVVLSSVGLPLDTWQAQSRAGRRVLRQGVREFRPDVVFVPTARWIDAGRAPVVAMVRNMEPLEVPFGGNPPSESLRNLARRSAARRACRRARLVLAVSAHVRDFLTGRWDLPPEKVPLVYHGVDTPADAAPAAAPAALRRVERRGFLFTAGSIRPARGLEDLIDALPLLSADSAIGMAVIAGAVAPRMDGHYASLLARARRLGVAERILWTGALTEEEMRWCYSKCTAFVMTSRAEACPNVALEAMSYGCVCVSVDRPPMPEFFGDAASYYRAGEARALTRAVQAAGDPAGLPQRRAGAAARARSFRWTTTVENTVAQLRRAQSS